MSRKKKAKPYDPSEAAKHRAEREANAAEVARLRAQPSTAVNVDKRTGRLVGAWRMNCFNALLPERCQERDAVDWLDTLIRTAAGENGQERRPDFIRASNDGAPGQNVTADMIAAGEVLTVIQEAMTPRDIRMLFELLKPDADLITRWRAVVERCTGEGNAHAQGAAVRAACASLVHARANAGRLVRERRERRLVNAA
jgi:hypothetical protein